MQAMACLYFCANIAKRERAMEYRQRELSGLRMEASSCGTGTLDSKGPMCSAWRHVPSEVSP